MQKNKSQRISSKVLLMTSGQACEDAANKSVIKIRDLVTKLQNQKTKHQEIKNKSADLICSLQAVEKEIYQVKNESPKDKIADPIKLNDRLTGLRTRLEKGDGLPNKAFYMVYEKLSAELEGYLSQLEKLIDEDLSQLNQLRKKNKLTQIKQNDE